jgi:peptidoglycan/xylan/chitin deacetylase (PgdA/CDA1 family)
MDRCLDQLSRLLQEHDGRATLPITAVVLSRNNALIQKYVAERIEFIVHGYTHIDYSQLAGEEQVTHLRHAREVFAEAGIGASGFRSPYLRRESKLHGSLEATGFSYVSNQPILWDVLDARDTERPAYAEYERAVAYYDPWRAGERPSVPRICHELVEIPVSLPDDEMLLDRLDGEGSGMVTRAWRRILSQSHEKGELFTIQLHPERITLCADALAAVLAEASALAPSVWVARLDEIADWWRAREAAIAEVTEAEAGTWTLSIAGPPGTTVLARGVELLGPAERWTDDYWQVAPSLQSTTHEAVFRVRAGCRPFVGVSPACPPELASFLRQQGYVCQVDGRAHSYSVYLDRDVFGPEDERGLLAEIEEGADSLVRLGRWPNGARSALSVTGDVDALTLWDYALRLFGK